MNFLLKINYILIALCFSVFSKFSYANKAFITNEKDNTVSVLDVKKMKHKEQLKIS